MEHRDGSDFAVENVVRQPMRGNMSRSLMGIYGMRLHKGVVCARESLADNSPLCLLQDSQLLVDWFETAEHKEELDVVWLEASRAAEGEFTHVRNFAPLLLQLDTQRPKKKWLRFIRFRARCLKVGRGWRSKE